MIIGITYDLREDYLKEGYSDEEAAEFDSVETIEAIETVLEGHGYKPVRIGNIKDLVNKLSLGMRWDMVFNISEGLKGVARESQVPALLDAYGIPYTFSDPLVLALSLHKGMAKRIVRDLGVPTPRFLVVDGGDNISTGDIAFPMFVKPVAEGTSKGIDRTSKVHDARELKNVCTRLLNKFNQPVLVEEYLSGREFTVGIVGTGSAARIVGVMEIIVKDPERNAEYTYYNKINYKETMRYKPVRDRIGEACGETALKVWRGLGCRDGGRVDLKLDADGIPNFIEVNPLAGLNPTYSDLPLLSRMCGVSYEELIGSILQSSLENIKPERKHHGFK